LRKIKKIETITAKYIVISQLMYYNFVDRKLNIKDKQIKGRVVKIHRSPATVMGDESCNRPLLNTFTLVINGKAQRLD
jgi:hypothetical protein